MLFAAKTSLRRSCPYTHERVIMVKSEFPQTAPNASFSPLVDSLRKRAKTTPPGMCPLSLQLALLEVSTLQSCGKCVPCGEGLPQLARLLRSVVECEANEETLAALKRTAQMIHDTSDCVTGSEAAGRVLEGLDLYADEYQNHIENHRCELDVQQTLPCETGCPAHVDIPAYIAYAAEGDYETALKVIRQDNPFPAACAYVCENPCEEYCKRGLVDSPLNIRGIKRYIVEQAPSNSVPTPAALPDTGKRIAIVGGGPSGLTSAYYLALMGHKVSLFEQRSELGGMLRYGIPAYRLPRERLDDDINAILSAGSIEVHLETTVEPDDLKKLQAEHDAVYLAIGAQNGNALTIEGANSDGVMVAVDVLDKIDAGKGPDFKGKKVVIIGGGNVAMDCARTAIRGGAEVSVVYRRRKEDMTALLAEIDSTLAEGVELLTLQAPVAIEVNDQGHCTALVTQPQMVGALRNGRPELVDANKPQRTIEADYILVAVGQSIATEGYGLSCTRGRVNTNSYLEVEGQSMLFAGGDCKTGPATAIKAIGAGKVAARNIDEALGYHHSLEVIHNAPAPRSINLAPLARVEILERPAKERVKDFESVEESMSHEELVHECSRCLRCDYHGGSVVEGGRIHND